MTSPLPPGAPGTFLANLGPRPRRGDPESTRARLLAAAADLFDAHGYHGTDSNRIARAAGYATGTFYKHFETKQAIFVAVYDEWLTRGWDAIADVVTGAGDPEERAEEIVDAFLQHHARWHGFRTSLRALVETDEEVRAHYRARRGAKLDLLASLHEDLSPQIRSRERSALLLFTLERTADALAGDEATALGLEVSRMRSLLVDLVARHL